MTEATIAVLYFVTVLVGIVMCVIGAVNLDPPTTPARRAVAAVLLGWGGGFLMIVALKLTIWLVLG